jgi:uncharacterized protein YktA (UPF0223 family)
MAEEEQNQQDMGEDFSTEELAESNNFVLNALIDLLIEKKVITEDELMQKYDELQEVDVEDDGDSEE